MPFFDLLDADADVEPDGSGELLVSVCLLLSVPSPPSLLCLRLDLRFEESRGACCGDVSPEVPEDGLPESVMPLAVRSMSTYPALDIAAAAPFLPLVRTSSGESGVSNSVGAALGFLVRRVSR